MPDVLTHYIFGLDTIQNLKDSPFYPCLKKYKDLFIIGLQGPDPIYYHHLLKKDNKAFISSKMHTEKTGDFIISTLCQLKKHEPDSEIFQAGISYLSGFICHYILDSIAHPYIFYLGGRYLPDCPDTQKYMGLHRKIELAIDTILLKERFSLKSSSFKVHQQLLQNTELPASLVELLNEALFLTYGINDGGNLFKTSYKDMRTYYQLTYDRLGTKKKLAKAICPLVNRSLTPFMGSFSYHNCLNPDFDYMNKARKVWLHPVTGNVYTFSFYDLLRNATKKSTALIQLAFDFLNSTITTDTLRAALPNISYLTGLPTSDTRPLKYISNQTELL